MQSFAQVGLDSLGAQRRPVLAATMAMSGVALFCALTSTAASAYGDASTIKSFAWGVAHGETKGFEATLSSGLGQVVRETTMEAPTPSSWPADGMTTSVITTKASAFDDVDCPDDEWCSSCAGAQSETWTAALSGIAATAMSLYAQYLRYQGDSAEAKFAGVATAMTAFATLLIAVLKFARECTATSPESFQDVKVAFDSVFGPGWHLVLMSAALNLVVGVVHVLTPVLRAAGQEGLAAQLLDVAPVSARKFAPAPMASRVRAAPINASADAEAAAPFVPDMEKRRLMNNILLGSTAATVGGLGGPFLYYFYPRTGGGGGGGLVALDAEGNEVTFEGWLKTHAPGERALVQGLKGDPYYLITNEDKTISKFALNAVCTHLGCVVPWNKAQNKFMCPCHGSQYNSEGKVVRGPAPLSLALSHIEDKEGKVTLTPWTETDFRTNEKPWWN